MIRDIRLLVITGVLSSSEGFSMLASNPEQLTSDDMVDLCYLLCYNKVSPIELGYIKEVKQWMKKKKNL